MDCIVTSPPYWGLRDYGTAQWEGGNPNCEHKKSRFNYAISDKQKSNLGSSGLGSYKNNETCKCGAKRIDSQLGLEKKITDYVNNLADVFDECKRVLKKTGTAWLNIGDSYAQKGLKAKDLCLIPFRVALELQQRGWYVRSDIIWHKPNPMPESVKDRPTKSHEHIFLLSKSKNYYYDADTVREPCQEETKRRMILGNKGKIGKNKNSPGWKQLNKYWGSKQSKIDILKGRNKRDVWTITTKPYKEAHFATFPKDLIEPCIKAGCPENGVVLDPFAGSGTVGEVAKELQKDFILIELNPEYIKLIEKRVNKLL